MTVRHTDDWLTIHGGDCRDVLATLPDESVNCVVTSPPYWGLRDYGTATWDGGDTSCDHIARPLASSKSGLRNDGRDHTGLYDGEKLVTNGVPYRARCGKCGATRQDRQLGLEPTPEEYVANMVAVFREARRVLRSDGTLWLNLGDSYATGPTGTLGDKITLGGGQANQAANLSRPSKLVAGLKPKDLVGIPWRVAFALQADGWYLRSDIIWAKPNPMPESVTDRPTKAHEYLFLLSKSPRYWFDNEAVRLPVSPNWERGKGAPMPELGSHVATEGRKGHQAQRVYDEPKGANVRTVWTVATQPYPGAHFAVMPEALVEPCVLAGCPDQTCATCGAPWERVVERTKVQTLGEIGGTPKGEAYKREGLHTDSSTIGRSKPWGPDDGKTTTLGWKPTCDHDAPTVPGVTLDPFGGSGTVARVANRLSRRAVLIDLNPEYLEQQMKRNRDMPLGLTAA